MRFPKISDVAHDLRNINRMESYARGRSARRADVGAHFSDEEGDHYIEVRLQVYEDGDWTVRWGDSQYDQDHRGYWGSSSVPGNGKRFKSEEVARDLINQARDHASQ